MRQILAALLLLAVAAIAIACGGSDKSIPTSSPSPAPPATSTIAAVTPSAQATLPAGAGLRLLVREFTAKQDKVTLLDPKNPTEKLPLASIDHPVNLGIVASLSPDGKTLAYNAVPLGTADRETGANLWQLDLSTGQSKMLASKVQLAAVPTWSPDGGIVVDKRSVSDVEQIIAVRLAGGEPTVLATGEGLSRMVAIGVSPQGTLYYSTSDVKGDDIWSVPVAGGTPAKLLHTSDRRTRNWSLAPDGSHIALLDMDPDASAAELSTVVIDTAAGEKQTLQPGDNGDDTSPIWSPDGRAITLGKRDSEHGEAISVDIASGEVTHHGVPGIAYDAPVSWSPDGAYLVVQNFGAQTPTVDIVSADGQRAGLGDNTAVTVIGWLTP